MINNQENTNKPEFIEAEVIESKPLQQNTNSFNDFEIPPTNKKPWGCMIGCGCLILFIIVFLSTLFSIVGGFFDIISYIIP